MTPMNALYHHTTARPAGTAFIYDDAVWTYQDLLTGSEQLARALLARGVRHGDRVVLHMANRPEMAVAVYACFRIGAIACPMNLRFKTAELREMFQRLRPALYLGEAWLYAEVETIEPDILAREKRFVTGRSDAHEGAMPWSALLIKAARPEPLLPEPDKDTPVLLLTTSGTTGQPKFIIHTPATISASVEACAHYHLDRDQIVLNAVPMVHASGLFILLASVNFGAAMVFLERFAPDVALDQIETHRCTWMLGLPFMWQAALEHQQIRPRQVGSLRHCFSAGDVCPIQLQADFEAAFSVPLRIVWGATEVVGSLTYGLQPGPVTRIAPGAEVRLVDDAGRPVPRGEVGEFIVRGPNVTVGYWIGPDRIDALAPDGWFHSGDLMRQGEGDELWFVGRTKDLIIRGGSNVSPVEVERVLLSHPLVRDAAVFGVPDPVLGQRVAAVVRLAGDGGYAARDDILSATRKQLADYKVPEWLVAVDAVPRNPLGKVDRQTLAAMATLGMSAWSLRHLVQTL
jgi:long-chain acyl-CoA synthetase